MGFLSKNFNFLNQYLSYATQEFYPDRSYIFLENSVCEKIFFILRGQVVVQFMATGKEILLTEGS